MAIAELEDNWGVAAAGALLAAAAGGVWWLFSGYVNKKEKPKILIPVLPMLPPVLGVTPAPSPPEPPPPPENVWRPPPEQLPPSQSPPELAIDPYLRLGGQIMPPSLPSGERRRELPQGPEYPQLGPGLPSEELALFALGNPELAGAIDAPRPLPLLPAEQSLVGATIAGLAAATRSIFPPEPVPDWIQRQRQSTGDVGGVGGTIFIPGVGLVNPVFELPLPNLAPLPAPIPVFP